MRELQSPNKRTIHSSLTRYLVTCSLAAGLICATAVMEQASAADQQKKNPAVQTQQSQQATENRNMQKDERMSEANRSIRKGNRALVGREVRSTNSETIGEIENVVADNTGEIQYFVVTFDGIWGIGEDEVMVPRDKVSLTKNRNYVFFKGTEEELEMLPDYNEYGWAGRRYGSRPNAWFNTESQLYEEQPEVSGVYGNQERQDRRMARNTQGNRENSDVQAYSPSSEQKQGMHSVMKQKRGESGHGKYNDLSQIRSSDNPMNNINWQQFEQNGIHASNLLDKSVQNSNGENLGSVEDVIIGRDGRIRLVLDVGQSTGQKNKRVQADLSDIQIKPEADHIVYDVSKDELKNDPDYKGGVQTASMKRDMKKGGQHKMSDSDKAGKQKTDTKQ